MLFLNCKKNINIFDGSPFGLYTVPYEDYKQIFFKAISCHIYYAADDFDGIGMDNADYVHDEIPY